MSEDANDSVLNDFNTTKIDFSTANSDLTNGNLIAVKGDHNGRGFKVTVSSGLDLLNTSAIFYWKNYDGGSGMSTMSQNKSEMSVFELTYPEEMLKPGQVQATISLVNQNNKTVLNSRAFNIKIEDSAVDEDAIKMDNNYSTLNEILVTWHELPAKVNEELGKIPDLVQTQIDKILSDLVGGKVESETPATIKTKYESNPDTNAYTDSDKQKLAGLKQAMDNGHLWNYSGQQNTNEVYYTQLSDDISQLEHFYDGDEDHKLTLGDFVVYSGMIYIVDKPPYQYETDTTFSSSPMVTGMTPQGLMDFFEHRYEDLEKDVGTKLDKVDGKGLSTNDFTDELKAKLERL
ncbi:MAG: BppU family phage baseplate upper protein [Lactobacillaceae bacterium]|nr:BppU family phage baseplate upper protein [Lactobacillaceae bacterium]